MAKPGSSAPSHRFAALLPRSEPGGYDFVGTGFTRPVTGLAHGHDLVCVEISRPRVENGRLVIKAGSRIRWVGDLWGHRVCIAHGSWQTTLLLFALDQQDCPGQTSNRWTPLCTTA